MDFITDLPLCDGFDTILVVVDRFTKMSHFIACNKSISAEETAKLILQQVVRLHGLPQDIVSDRGPQFAARFWRRLFKLFGTKINLSTAFHPQTDGQTERVNQILEQYLRCTINYQQNNWAELLHMAEFAYNNSIHTATKQTPFFANYGYNPRMHIMLSSQPEVPAAEDLGNRIKKTQEILTRELAVSQESQRKFANKKRLKHPEWKIGDKVWLVRKHIKTSRPSGKLDYRKLGPFKIDC
jgi:hypothetical protein